MVDKVPSTPTGASIALPTSQNAVRMGDDRSMTTWNTVATTNGNAGVPTVVDRFPSFSERVYGNASVASGATEQAVKFEDDLSVATFNTMTTHGRSPAVVATLVAAVVDRIPPISE